MPSQRRKQSLDVMAVSHLGVSLAISVGLFTYAGYRLDSWLETSPLLLIVGAFLGLGSGMWSVVRAVHRLESGPSDEEAPDDPP